VQFSGTKDYWGHIFNFPGVPWPVKIILTPIEVVSLFIKPMALMIRLFANIVAGHFMVLSLVGLIFIMTSLGGTVAGAVAAPFSIAFTVGIMLLELLVAAIQAYIFTLLTTVFIGQALETHDHDHSHDAGQMHKQSTSAH
jgi:F-type H+-transporting ATPase subunit a